jgi:hypothetical protein
MLVVAFCLRQLRFGLGPAFGRSEHCIILVHRAQRLARTGRDSVQYITESTAAQLRRGRGECCHPLRSRTCLGTPRKPPVNL